MRFFHRKKNRLYAEKEIGFLFTQGSAHFIYPIKVIYQVYNCKDATYKVLVSVSKRNFKKAVDRNLIKRRIKEAFRKNTVPLLKSLEGGEFSINIALVYVSKKILDYKEIEDLVIRQNLFLTNQLEKIE